MKKNYIQPAIVMHKLNLNNACMAPSSPGSASSIGDQLNSGTIDSDAKDDVFGEMDLNRAMEILDEFDW